MMGSQGMKRSIKVLALTAVMALSVATFSDTAGYVIPSEAAKSVSDLKKEQANNAKKIKELKASIEANKNAIAKQEQNQAYIQQQIELTNKNLQLIWEQYEQLKKDVDAKLAEIAQQEKDIDKGIADFKERLRTMYITGGDSMAEVLMGSTDFYQLLSRSELVRRVSVKNEEVIDDLAAQLTQLQADKKELEEKKAETEAAYADLKQTSKDLDSAYASSQKEQERKANEIEEYKQSQAECERKEQELENEVQKALAAAKLMATYVGGTYTWPLPGFTYISSPFSGSRTLNGVTKPHKGVDIAGSGVNGASIVAANDGKVITASSGTWGGGYGTYAMIDHGGGQVTLYGHCSSLLVSVGQTVKKGQAIAKVGNTGDSTGPHLHFEIRVNGAPTNPMNQFKSG